MGALFRGELVGTAGLSWPESDEARPTPFIWGVYVAPKVRGQGLAALMMEALLRRARGYGGLEDITLDCFGSSIAALALYRKLGFRLVHLEPGAIHVGDEVVDLYHMALELR